MDCSVLGGSSHLVGIWRRMRLSPDEIRVFVPFGLQPCGLKKSMDCEVKVLEHAQRLIFPVILGKTVDVCFAHLCN